MLELTSPHWRALAAIAAAKEECDLAALLLDMSSTAAVDDFLEYSSQR